MSSLRPAHIVLNPYFYPAGNSPAVCLTQDVPPERDAALLLLGCGDIRNILFTIYSGSGTDNRRLDFTCCDLEAEIIARNALLLTSILDDPTGDHTQQLWNIYYHNFLDSASASLLQTQAAKLVAQAQSPEAWETGSYAQFVEFGDSTTFAKVLELWKTYATPPADKKQHIQLQAKLRAQWRAAKKWQEIKVEPHALQLTGGRSFAPVLQEAPAALNKTYRTYWRTGTCLENEEMTSQLTIANPMFMCLRDGLQLHYGTSPLLGFHHAAAYTRLSTESPLKTSEADIKEMPKPMASALTQFSEWCKAFRLTATRVKVRYVYSEAIAFCHVLRHQQLHGGARSANWYRNNWGYDRLELDATCYGPRGNAPTAFDVIDTSNLTDHLGILNVLAAAGPLLVSRLAATIRTEVFIPPETTASESAKALLSGDLPTVALLLGLKPVHFWSDATASWHVNDSIELDSIHAAAMVSSMSRQIILWGPTETTRVEWIAPSLADFVFKMYHTMFQDENLHSLLGLLNTGSEGMLARKLHTYEMYSRASLAVILLHIKNSGVVEWRPFIEGFLDMVIQDRTLMLGGHSYQSLLVYIQMLGLADLATFAHWHPVYYQKELQKGPLRNWSTIPPTVCVTMAVPHSAVAMFADLLNGCGTPQCHIMTQTSLSAKQNVYPDIQLGFGTITTSGTKFTDDYTLSIKDDSQGWSGKAPLIVSTMVSTLGLVFEGDPACEVKLCLKIGAIEEVKSGLDGEFSITVKPALDSTGSRVSTLAVHFKTLSAKATAFLQSGGSVDVQLRDPFNLVLKVYSGDDLCQETVQLPMPLESCQGQTKIARKSMWIEYSAPVADSTSLSTQPNALFPLRKHPRSSTVELEQLHYVCPDVLPVLHIDTKGPHAMWLKWLTSGNATMSVSELDLSRKLQKRGEAPLGRMGVKDRIFQMISQFADLNSTARCSNFRIEDAHGTVAIVMVHAIRMDLSNQTVFLDAAVIAMLNTLPKECTAAVEGLADMDMVGFKVSDQEALFWKHLLPAFAERCRQWQHKPSCEYKQQDMVPICTVPGESFMCSCGLGTFPDGYLENLEAFKSLARFSVRVAIPVIFPSPVSRDSSAPGLPTNINEPSHPKQDCCNVCSARKSSDGKPLQQCAGCKIALYCSSTCQKKDWKKGHKQLCSQLKED
ncbi:uncharacterized protein J4E88_007433 [Alternaria novae-zelandiae]|uniref:uncharacterized protein n=1 Tax=Alternaria novae-zelandiae TaxID=430562 RepID=UPI0020C3FCA4|nr:uncharacterized protein J4E88_007433 [Alternaria novae-zelandiae]KAI4676515.1 hypothetical protein J4E88_007433 [Alternaria novae-zelandiae]